MGFTYRRSPHMWLSHRWPFYRRMPPRSLLDERLSFERLSCGRLHCRSFPADEPIGDCSVGGWPTRRRIKTWNLKHICMKTVVFELYSSFLITYKEYQSLDPSRASRIRNTRITALASIGSSCVIITDSRALV